jgi:hypothetical protein
VTETRPARPVLATVISIWEVFIVVMAITSRVAVKVLLHRAYRSTHTAPHAVSSSPLLEAAIILGYALAIAAAITLWQMRRIAFAFLTARFCLELTLFLVAMMRPVTLAGTRHPGFRFIVIAIDIAALALNAAIAWYAWYVTTPTPELGTAQAPDPASPRPAEPELTTSQFYLSPDHKTTIHKD